MGTGQIVVEVDVEDVLILLEVVEVVLIDELVLVVLVEILVLVVDVEIEDGVTGADLQKIYDTAYENLFKNSYEKLMDRLGLVDTIVTGNVKEIYEIQEENTIFEKLKERDALLEKENSPIEKEKLKKQINLELGKTDVARVDFINNNFNKIIEEFANAKINIFFEEGKEDFDKNCE